MFLMINIFARCKNKFVVSYRIGQNGIADTVYNLTHMSNYEVILICTFNLRSYLFLQPWLFYTSVYLSFYGRS